MRFHIVISAFLLTVAIRQASADDAERFVANLPLDARADVLFIMDISASKVDFDSDLTLSDISYSIPTELAVINIDQDSNITLDSRGNRTPATHWQ